MGPYYDHQVGRFERADPLHERDILLARARRARAEATRQAFGAVYRSLKAAARAATTLGNFRHRQPARLTGGCN